MQEDARQDLGLQVLGHQLPTVPAGGHQHVAGRVPVALLQLPGAGRKEEWSGLVGSTATVHPVFR